MNMPSGKPLGFTLTTTWNLTNTCTRFPIPSSIRKWKFGQPSDMVEVFTRAKSVAIHPRNFRQGRFSPHRVSTCHPIISLWRKSMPNNWCHGRLQLDRKQQNWSPPPSSPALFPEQAYRSCLGISEPGKKVPNMPSGASLSDCPGNAGCSPIKPSKKNWTGSANKPVPQPLKPSQRMRISAATSIINKDTLHDFTNAIR